MARLRRTLDRVRRLKPRVDRAKIELDDGIQHPPSHDRGRSKSCRRTHGICPGHSPASAAQAPRHDAGGVRPGIAYLRLATLRNWEQGRVLPDPAARSLLTIVARNPRAAFKALAG